MLAGLDLWEGVLRICWGGCEPRPGLSGHPDRSWGGTCRRSRGATGETDLGACSFPFERCHLMVRSMTKRGMPKPFAILIAVLMALYFVPFAALSPANAAGFQYTLEGCRLAGNNTLPNADGKFICTDAEYTTGNLGKSWNELDLVPHRVTV